MKRFLLIGLGVIIFLLLCAFAALRNWQAEKQPQGKTELHFSAVELPFEHDADLVNSLPFLAGEALDIDGDGLDGLFLSGGDRQADALPRVTIKSVTVEFQDRANRTVAEPKRWITCHYRVALKLVFFL